MTYQELYRAVSTWNARHIAQDLMMENGAEGIATEFDIQQVIEAGKEEAGISFSPSALIGRN